MEKTIQELENAIERIGTEGYSNEHGFLTDDRDWHEVLRLMKSLRDKAKLLNANPAISNGLRAPPVASGNVQ